MKKARRKNNNGDDDGDVNEPSNKRTKMQRETTFDWIQFSENIDRALLTRRDPNVANAELVETTLSRTLNLVESYDVNSCKLMLENMIKFTDLLEKDNSCVSEGFSLINNITKRRHTFPYGFNLTMKRLREYFGISGHAFSVDMQKSYVIPMGFDLDCKDCKNKSCSRNLSPSVYADLADSICNQLNDKFPIDLNENYALFKARDSCNIHVYYNISVSIVLYHEMIDALIANLPSDITDKFKIDKVKTFALPFSAKKDCELYSPLNVLDEERLDNMVASSATDFYDTETFVLSSPINYAIYKSLGHFNYNVGSIEDEWLDSADVCKNYLAIKLNYDVLKFSDIRNRVASLKNANVSFVSENDINLQAYINEATTFDSAIYSVDSKKIDEDIERGDNVINRLVLREIKSVSKKIAKLTYNVKAVCGADDQYNYLISFLVADSCGYTFYTLMAICIFIVSAVSREERIDKITAKFAVLNIIKKIVRHSGPFQEKKMLIRTISVFVDFDILTNLETQIGNPGEWLSEITRLVKLKQLDGDVSKLILSSVVQLSDNCAISELIENYFKYSANLIKLAVEKSLYYYYSNGLYIECKESDLVGKSLVRVKTMINDAKKLITELEVTNQVEKMEPRVKNEIIDRAWFSYIQNAKLRRVNFNMYDYFISTERGVFNTLNGTYMKNISLLYFKTTKMYCTFPSHSNVTPLGLNELNSLLVDEYIIYQEIVRKIVEKQSALFYSTIVNPGLVLLRETVYNKNTSVNIINMYRDKIMSDKDKDNERELYYMMPIISRYNFELNSVMRVYKLLTITLNHSARADISDMKNVFEHYLDSDTSRLTVTRIKDVDAVNLARQVHGNAEKFVEEIKATYKIAFIPQLFVITYFMCVFDQFQADCFLKTTLNVRTVNQDDAAFVDALKTSEIDSCSAKNYEARFKRACNILFAEVKISDSFLSILSSYSAAFGFDRDTLDDFLTFTAMIYYPGSLRKFLLLLIGSPKCGKTTIQSMLRETNQPSCFGTDTVFGSKGSGSASPDLIQIYSTYLTNIIEVKKIDTETLKTLTGGDHVNKRNLHQNDFKDLQPVTFVIGVANEMPQMSNADEAIRERLAIFMMKMRYIDTTDLELGIHEDNPLLLFSSNLTTKPKTANISELAREFSNVLFAQYVIKRNCQGVVIPKMKNLTSRQATESFLIKNNLVYEIFDKSGIVFNPDLEITMDDLKERVSEKIDYYNETHSYNVKVVWSTFKRKILVLFANYLLSNNESFKGFGFTNNQPKNLEKINLVDSLNDNLLIIDLRRYLQDKYQWTQSQTVKFVNECKEKYGARYDDNSRLFKDLRLPEY